MWNAHCQDADSWRWSRHRSQGAPWSSWCYTLQYTPNNSKTTIGIAPLDFENALARRSGLDEQLVLRGLWRSECLGSTGIGRGVAIPHALFDMISSPAASFTRLMPAIDFGGPDDDPVDIVYTLLWPRSAAAAFLPALSQVCRVLRAVRTREELRQAHSADEVMAILDAAPSSGISISSHTHRAGRVVMSTQLSNA